MDSYERKVRRAKKYDFSKSKPVIWTEKLLREFVMLNDKLHDYELAKKFGTSIYAVQHIRQRINHAKNIILSKNSKAKSIHTRKDFMELIQRDTKTLRAMA